MMKKFMKEITDIIELIKANENLKAELPQDTLSFVEDFENIVNKMETAAESGITFTENGRKIFDFMKENMDKYNNIFKAKDIAEGLFISGRSVSGSIRKLITDGVVLKEGKDPVVYSLSSFGRELS